MTLKQMLGFFLLASPFIGIGILIGIFMGAISPFTGE
jgi:hypothetical protein